MLKGKYFFNLLGTLAPYLIVLIPLFFKKMQKMKKEKINKISEVTKYVTDNIMLSMNYVLISFGVAIVISIILSITSYRIKINQISYVRYIITCSVLLVIPLLHLFYPKSKKIRKELLNSLCDKETKNLLIFYLPSLITILNVLMSLYIKFDNKNLYNIIVTISMFLSIVIILLYFMSYKSYDKYETVIIHFTNSYKYDDIIRYNEFSIEDGFVVIKKKIDNKYILRKYNCNIVADIEIVGVDRDEEYLEFINKRGFKK